MGLSRGPPARTSSMLKDPPPPRDRTRLERQCHELHRLRDVRAGVASRCSYPAAGAHIYPGYRAEGVPAIDCTAHGMDTLNCTRTPLLAVRGTIRYSHPAALEQVSVSVSVSVRATNQVHAYDEQPDPRTTGHASGEATN